MDWHKLSRKEKAEWLSQQLEGIQRAKDLFQRFEQMTEKWLNRPQTAEKKT